MGRRPAVPRRGFHPHPPSRDPVEKQGGTTFTFVTDGLDSALEEARAAAGHKDVSIAGGASVIQQCLRAGLVDEFQLHVVPVVLGDGVRLFGELRGGRPRLERVRVIDSRAVTYLYRVLK